MNVFLPTVMAEDRDFNDVLDDIAFVDDRFQREGFDEGTQAGRRSGIEEGMLLGIEQGAKIGSELGFYYGFAERWQLQNNEDKENERLKKALDSLKAMITDFPKANPHDTSIEGRMLKIRAKYKQVSSILGIKSSGDSASTGISF